MPEPSPPAEEHHAWGEEAGFYEADEFEPPRRPWWRAAAGWLLVVAALAVLGFGFRAAGQRYHNPPSRIPAPPSAALEAGIFGGTRAVLSDLQAIERLVPAGVALSLSGGVDRIEFPRTLGDRLAGKRNEDALVFRAATSSGVEFRVLTLRDSGSTVLYAVEPPARRRGADGPEGFFTGIPPGAMRDAIEGIIDEVEAASERRHSSSDLTIFGPFHAGDEQALRNHVEGNTVLRHLVAQIQAAGGDVSVAAPAFLILQTPPDRVINAIYQPQTNLVMQPLWGTSQTASLAHELVHAYLDEAVADATALRRRAQTYLEEHQPSLYTNIVGDLYERLDRLGQAEEALAFIVGAIAARQPTTVAPIRLLENQQLLSASAGLLTTDVEFLISIGLLPRCMDPATLGHANPRIDFAFYDLVDAAC